ncbi:MAG: phosphatase, partial [Nocardioidaceae bacterium]
GLDVLAITDHDTAAGWAEAASAANELGLSLVRGMEISTRHRGRGVHLLAYLPDPTHPALADELARILTGREARIPALLGRLRELGIDIDEDDVRRVSDDAAAMGRPHVADALVALGAVPDRDAAFATYLSAGRPAYVDRYAAPLVDMIQLVDQAGGASVVAHPWGRHERSSLDEETLADLQRVGLGGIEVDHQDHDDHARKALRSIARNLDLVVTGSSDHHGLGKLGHDLGCNTTDPGEYERLLDLAVTAAARSGCNTPAVVGEG